MSFNDCKISGAQIQTTGVQSQADTLTGSAQANKLVFDALPTLVIQKLNSLIDQLQQQAAAGQIGVTAFGGMTAQTLQAALEQIQADIGGNYGGEDGAGKVGYTPSEGVEEDTVQAAIEAVQANLTAYIAKIKAATGAAEVGNAPIAGMRATNVQHALEELRKNIDNIVSGIIPGGSITSEMIQDGAVTADKLGSDVTGEEIPTSASDPTSISSQLSNKLYKYTKIQEAPQSWSELWALEPGVYSWVQQAPLDWQPADTNSGLLRVELTIHSSGQSAVSHTFILSYIDGVNYLKRYYGEQTGDGTGRIAPIATATPPEVHNLTLASGITNISGLQSVYFKRQENIVTVILQCEGTLSDNGLAATLPVDCYPARNMLIPCFDSSSGNRLSGFLRVNVNGTIHVSYGGSKRYVNVLAAFSFDAAEVQ